MDISHHHSARRGDERRPNSAKPSAELPVPANASLDELRQEWRRLYHCKPPRLSRDLLVHGIGYRLQELQHGGLSKSTRRKLKTLAKMFRSEERVFGGLKEKPMAPELVREFIRAFQEEVNRTNAEREEQFTADRQQLDSIGRKIAGIVSAIEEGDYSRALGNRLADLEKQQELLEARLSEAPPSTVRLHPRLAEVYAEKVQQLEQALNDPNIRAEAADVLRSLINRIELHPKGDGQGIAATLHGDLAQILALCDGSSHKQKLPKAGASGSQLSVVAGARNQRYLQLDYAIL